MSFGKNCTSLISAAIVLFLLLNDKVQAQHIAQASKHAKQSLVEHILQERPLLIDMLTTAGLVPALSSSTAYTLLAPPDEALEIMKEESPERLRLLLAGHILKGRYLQKDLKDGATVETLAGTSIKICRKKGSTLVNGVKITSTEASVENGVLHHLGSAMSY